MRKPRIYLDRVLVCGNSLVLEAAARNHLANVLRLKPGADLVVFNGEGGEFKATILSASRKHAEILISEFSEVSRESSVYTSIAFSASRNDRMDWIVQKATELGANILQPLTTERVSIRRDRDQISRRMDHWRKVSIGACEQSGRNSIPLLYEPQNLGSWLDSDNSDIKLLLDQQGEKFSLAELPTPRRVSILSGPEGGFSETEVAQAKAAGCITISLGRRTMRAETAPLAGLSIVQSNWGDF